MTEWQIIEKYFAMIPVKRDDVVLGIGDDAALLHQHQQQQLVVTTDTLIAGVHFPENTQAFDIGYKALAVNVSDLAAMGATPAWFSLALTLPAADECWLQAFTEGMSSLMQPYQLALIGGDLTRGSMAITISIIGFLPLGKGLLRSQARVGDDIYVTGSIGDAGAALAYLQGSLTIDAALMPAALQKLNRPEPRVQCGQALLDVAHAAIDISDGLLADLQHILQKSQVGATIDIEKLPLSTLLAKQLPRELAMNLALSSGDDYELCFTADPLQQTQIQTIAQTLQLTITKIGKVEAMPGLRWVQQDKAGSFHRENIGYQHF